MHACRKAIYLKNRLSTKVLKYKQDYETLYKRVVDYDFLNVFGSLCYHCFRAFNKHKLQACSAPYLFLKYPSKHKGYLCLHRESIRIYIKGMLYSMKLNFLTLSHRILIQKISHQLKLFISSNVCFGVC